MNGSGRLSLSAWSACSVCCKTLGHAPNDPGESGQTMQTASPRTACTVVKIPVTLVEHELFSHPMPIRDERSLGISHRTAQRCRCATRSKTWRDHTTSGARKSSENCGKVMCETKENCPGYRFVEIGFAARSCVELESRDVRFTSSVERLGGASRKQWMLMWWA